jgi:hypothetical protein
MLVIEVIPNTKPSYYRLVRINPKRAMSSHYASHGGQSRANSLKVNRNGRKTRRKLDFVCVIKLFCGAGDLKSNQHLFY